MGNSTISCSRQLHTKYVSKTIFQKEKSVYEEPYKFQRRTMGLYKHEVYKMTLSEGIYNDQDTKYLILQSAYEVFATSFIKKNLLTIHFKNGAWRELWDDTAENNGQNTLFILRWVSAISDRTLPFYDPLVYKWVIKKQYAYAS